MSEEKRRDRRPLLAIFIAAILAAILVIGAWLWAASQPAVVPTHDVNPPEVFWSHLPTVPGDELRNAGPSVGLAYRMRPDSFDSRADRLYAAMPERLYAFETDVSLRGRNAWGSAQYFNVSEGATRRTITAGPVALNYGDYVQSHPDHELYLGTDDGRLYILRDTGDLVPSGAHVVSQLDLDGAVTGLAAYNGDMFAPAAIVGAAVHTYDVGGEWADEPLPSYLENRGEFASLALEAGDRPYVAFYDVSLGQPQVVRWWNGTWSPIGQIEPYTVSGNTGLYTSLAIWSDGQPRVAYYDEAETALKFARWDGSSWLTEYVDYTADVGRHASLAVDPVTDAPRIAYYNETGSLWFAAWSGTSWNLEMVSGGGVGEHASLALNASGEPRIAYLDATNGRLMLAAKTGMTWSTESVATVDSAPAPSGLGERGMSLRLDALGAPHIAFRNATESSLGYATKTGGSWSTTTVDNGGDVGLYPSLALDGAGRPAIAYHDASAADLKFARWTGSAWDVERVRSDGLVGLYASLAFDVAGRPHIASYEYNTSRTDADVVVAGTASGNLYGIDVNIPDTIVREPRQTHVLSWRYRIRWMTDVGSEVHLAGWPLMGRTNIPLYSPAFSPDGRLVFVGLSSAELLAVDPANGEIVWRSTLPGAIWGSAPVSFPSPLLSEDWVLAAGDDGTVSLYDDAGILLTSRATATGRLLTPDVHADRAMLASSAGEALGVRLSEPSPTILWTERLVGAASGSIAVREEALTTFFGDETGRVYSLRYDNGGLLYRAKFCDAVSAGPLVAVPPRSLQANVWFGCRDGSLYAVSSVSAPRPVP